MALIATTDNGQHFEWHVGEGSLKASVTSKYVESFESYICEIQADGYELEEICNQFTGIPLHKTARVQTWYGDLARFIFNHLR